MTNLNDNTGVHGKITVTLRDEDGNVKPQWVPNKLGEMIGVKIPFITGRYLDSHTVCNTYTNDALADLTNLVIGGGTIADYVYLAIGSGTTAADPTQTALVSEFTADGLSRVNASPTRTTENVTNDKITYNNTFTYTGSTQVDVNEAGIFNDASAGTMFARGVFGTTKSLSVNGESIEVTYEIYFN